MGVEWHEYGGDWMPKIGGVPMANHVVSSGHRINAESPWHQETLGIPPEGDHAGAYTALYNGGPRAYFPDVEAAKTHAAHAAVSSALLHAAEGANHPEDRRLIMAEHHRHAQENLLPSAPQEHRERVRQWAGQVHGGDQG